MGLIQVYNMVLKEESFDYPNKIKGVFKEISRKESSIC